ncbi:hypothetical protein EON71_00390 [bacterium]|nr:MAG: hypothetical protein EON71_00390 [bacterium]
MYITLCLILTRLVTANTIETLRSVTGNEKINWIGWKNILYYIMPIAMVGIIDIVIFYSVLSINNDMLSRLIRLNDTIILSVILWFTSKERATIFKTIIALVGIGGTYIATFLSYIEGSLSDYGKLFVVCVSSALSKYLFGEALEKLNMFDIHLYTSFLQAPVIFFCFLLEMISVNNENHIFYDFFALQSDICVFSIFWMIQIISGTIIQKNVGTLSFSMISTIISFISIIFFCDFKIRNFSSDIYTSVGLLTTFVSIIILRCVR